MNDLETGVFNKLKIVIPPYTANNGVYPPDSIYELIAVSAVRDITNLIGFKATETFTFSTHTLTTGYSASQYSRFYCEDDNGDISMIYVSEDTWVVDLKPTVILPVTKTFRFHYLYDSGLPIFVEPILLLAESKLLSRLASERVQDSYALTLGSTSIDRRNQADSMQKLSRNKKEEFDKWVKDYQGRAYVISNGTNS